MIVAMVSQANRPRFQTIYHVGTSVSNPFEIGWFHIYGYRYFSKQPWINKDGKLVIVDKFKVLNTMDSFKRYIAVRHALGLKVLVCFCILRHDLSHSASADVEQCLTLAVNSVNLGTADIEQCLLPIFPRIIS